MVCFLILLALALIGGCGADVPVAEPLDFSVGFPARPAAEMELGASVPVPEAEPEKGECSVAYGVLLTPSAEDTLGSMISAADVAVVEFTADWCGPCQALLPELEKLAAEHEAVAFWQVNIDARPGLCQEAGGIVSLPTVKVYSGVNEVGQVTGNYPVRLRGLLLSVLRERGE